MSKSAAQLLYGFVLFIQCAVSIGAGHGHHLLPLVAGGPRIAAAEGRRQPPAPRPALPPQQQRVAAGGRAGSVAARQGPGLAVDGSQTFIGAVSR